MCQPLNHQRLPIHAVLPLDRHRQCQAPDYEGGRPDGRIEYVDIRLDWNGPARSLFNQPIEGVGVVHFRTRIDTDPSVLALNTSDLHRANFLFHARKPMVRAYRSLKFVFRNTSGN
ncbi:hypothetical protein SCLCIDRAFT_1210143 [Scleroderma citrinum Foug A]|uniref:Uncharacterized protein n=1 Tax=Scleroderma citrinum Foug A TaxID=1036808 RepID=A0A0C3A1E1_9AGAM|nr:hypothetical protein SCLCIDRAFT_1210143 [Scleroderma citrinum Foug A]